MKRTTHNKYNDWASFVGTLLIGGLFAFAGFGKIMNFAGTVAWTSTVLPFATLLIVLTIILELAGGIMLVLGYKTRHVAFLLAGFTIIATIFFHNPMAEGQMLFFTKNLMIIGGLLHISAFGAGRISLDNKLS